MAAGHRITTWGFRQFKSKHVSLNQSYWIYKLGEAAIRQAIVGKPAGAQVADVIPAGFDSKRLPLTCDDYTDNADGMAGIYRLQLLVICSAMLEAYLQDSVRLYLGSIGHAKHRYSLDAVGDAIGAPVLRSSTVSDMLKYVEQLLKLDFGSDREKWITGYKLRCAAAHNGGVATAKVKKEVPSLRTPIGQPIEIEWDKLRGLLSSSFSIATQIDTVVSSVNARNLESQWLLEEAKFVGNLPDRKDIWRFLYTTCGATVSRAEKKRIETLLYP